MFKKYFFNYKSLSNTEKLKFVRILMIILWGIYMTFPILESFDYQINKTLKLASSLFFWSFFMAYIFYEGKLKNSIKDANKPIK